MPLRPGRFARVARVIEVVLLVAVVVALSAALGWLLPACKRRVEPPPATRSRRADRSVVLSGPSAAYVAVEAARPARGDSPRSLVARITYDERHVARIGPPINGRVAKVEVVTGDKVKAGDVLLTLSAPDIAGAQAQVAQAKTARGVAERAAERARILVEEGAGSEAERQAAEAAVAQAVSEEQRAVAALAAIGGAHGQTGYQLRAPIAGTVAERNVSVGTQVNADQSAPLLTIADLSTVWVVADVYEKSLARVRVGDEVAIGVLAFPGRRFEGKIAHVSAAIDPQRRAALARVELPNPDLSLRPGMFATMDVRGLSEGVAEVPMSAVLARRDQFYVFVRGADGAYAQREVTLGEQRGQHVTVLSGIVAGDPIVTDGAILLDAEANEAL
ncbi:MAG: efflux RND transporter periplasmic adaptor subunit [Labilithrix sp.]|nr:efflux RND transporter periplasmic adaptor subunit [Labilithrix sp.]